MEWEFKHYNQAPKPDTSAWRWINFTPYELRCKGSSRLLVVPEALDRLQALRVLMGKPLPINSAYRSPAHNMLVGGAPDSYHLKGLAFDINTSRLEPEELAIKAKICGFRGIIRYPAQDFIHIDLRKNLFEKVEK